MSKLEEYLEMHKDMTDILTQMEKATDSDYDNLARKLNRHWFNILGFYAEHNNRWPRPKKPEVPRKQWLVPLGHNPHNLPYERTYVDPYVSI